MKPHRTPLDRIAEAIATAEAEWSEGERLEAARALGWGHAMPEPQVEMDLTQGGGDGR